MVLAASVLTAALSAFVRADAAAAGNSEVPLLFYPTRAQPLLRSNDEFLVVSDPAQLAGVLAQIQPFASVLTDPRLDLPVDARRVQVRPGVVDGLSALRQVAGVRAVRPGYRLSPAAPPMFESGNVVIAFKPGSTAAQRGRASTDLGLAGGRAVRGLPDVYVYSVPAERDSLAVAAAAQQRGEVRYSQPDFFSPKDPLDIDDPLFPQQWHLQNTGQGGGTPLADVNAVAAWDISMGAGMTVAVLDNGEDIGHPDLAPALVGAYDYAEGDMDPSGGTHGTSVSGLAIGRANTIGIRGVAPLAGWLAMRYGSDVGIAESFGLADDYGAVVHTNSWKYSDPAYLPAVVSDAIHNAVTNARGGKGIAVIFAAANDAAPISTESALAAMPEVIAVGASTNQNHKAVYSNFGAELELVAPSSGGTLSITTTYPGNEYTFGFGGTSASAPQVAGAVALVASVNPALTAGQIRRIMQHTAQAIDRAVSPASAVEGHSSWFGYGLLDVNAAVQAAQMSLALGSITWPGAVTQLAAVDGPAGIALTWTNPNEDFAFALVVEARQPIGWVPSDGAEYHAGQVVAPGMAVRYVGGAPSFAHAGGPGAHHYAVFAGNAAQQYSWGAATTGVIGGSVVAIEDFESTAPGWTHDGPQDSWAVGAAAYFAGPVSAASGSGVFGTNLTGDYLNGSSSAVTLSARLRSPPLDLNGGNFAYASFSDWLGVEGGGYDHARLDVVDLDGNVLATLIDPYQDNHNDWRRQGVDLSAWSGSTVRLDFGLWANNLHTGPGWYLDDFEVVIDSLPQVFGDADIDGDVDLDDYAQWQACLTAPGATVAAACWPLDTDADADLDLADFAGFQQAFGSAP
jgi:subtilisin family serine protease